jgi:predicted DNA-binding antitoxin AbrB/MazE fold protein
MTRSLQAVFEKGALRPLEPLRLKEHQQVTVTVSDVFGFGDRLRIRWQGAGLGDFSRGLRRTATAVLGGF